MRLSRRQFLKAGGGTAAGLATASLLRPGRAAAKVQQQWKIQDTRQVASICPYCAVGCGTIVHARKVADRDWKLVNIEGHPESPISGGTLCPKGAASYQLAVNPNRQTKVLYRAAGATEWQEKPLDWALGEVAKRVKQTRDSTWQATAKDPTGKERPVNRTTAIGTLGGATMDNEWNYIHSKLFRSLGVVYVENQARI